MRLLVACFGVVLVCGLISQTACMTNREFVDSMMDSAEEVEESYPGDAGYDDKDEGAIELPGGPEDELDLEYLMIQTSLPEQLMAQLNSLSKSEPESSDLGWWRRRRRRRRARRPSTSCNCRSRSCHCCLRHTFSANLILKKVRFTLHACAYITYLPGEGVDIRFTMNSRNLYHKRISIRHPPGLCYGVPGLQYFAKVCLKFYNVDLRNKAFCLKLEGRLNLLVKKFRVNLKLGCYRIRDLTEEELQSLMNDSEALMTYLTSGDSAIETTGFDLTKTQSLRELMQHAEITEMYEDDETMEIE